MTTARPIHSQDPTPTELRQLLQASIEEIPLPAFVVDGAGSVVMTNAGGHELCARRPETTGAIASALRAETNPLGLASCGRVDGPLGLQLLVAREASDIRGRVAKEAARRWALTPRQAQVLAELVLGRGNKDISRKLECSPKTIELHVSAILEAAGAASRSELLSLMLRDA
jgi:DNA-binding CsgD family transcriptional regulator